MFLAIERVIEHPLLDLKLFRYRNFSLSMSLAIFRAVGLFGGVFLLPIFLETLVGIYHHSNRASADAWRGDHRYHDAHRRVEWPTALILAGWFSPVLF